MVTITQFNQICQDIRANVPGITEHILAVHEAQATKKLGTKTGIILLGIIPSADGQGRPGQNIDNNASLLFILEKEKVGADDVPQYQRLQTIILKIRDFIQEQSENGIPLFNRYKPEAATIDPENFSGFNGWSLSLEF